MIKLSQNISSEVPNGQNPQAMMDFLTQIKMCIEEMAQKAQARQIDIRSTAPGVDDLQEGEMVGYINAAVFRIYTKQNGAIKFWSLT